MNSLKLPNHCSVKSLESDNNIVYTDEEFNYQLDSKGKMVRELPRCFGNSCYKDLKLVHLDNNYSKLNSL